MHATDWTALIVSHVGLGVFAGNLITNSSGVIADRGAIAFMGALRFTRGDRKTLQATTMEVPS